ncbi:MAG: metalloregulator ArsR/SmtB family transcription factor [Proteobacteria bacterium]|nr:metalloregulator ArsR/SmtB family transcription factor [Pseudomonadota bacterium]
MKNLNDTTILLKLLSDQTRLRIILMLTKYRMCVCELCWILKMTQPAISKHLKKLRQAKIIDSEQSGLWTNYYISKKLSKQAITLLDHLTKLLKNDKIIKNDLKMAKVVDKTLCNFS